MKFSFDLFTDYFAGRDNRLRRLDARFKLAVALSLILAVLFSTHPVFPSMVFLACLAVFWRLKMPLKLLCLRLLAPFGIVLVLAALQTFLTGSTVWFTVPLGGWTLTATREGFLHGLFLGVRVLGSVSVLFLLGSVTAAYDFFRALRWCRAPHDLVEIAMLMYRYIFVLLDEASDMLAAQHVRLGHAGFKRSLSSMAGLMGGVMLRSMEQSFSTYEAMTARGYTGVFPFAPMPAMPPKERRALFPMLLLVALAFWAAERGLA